MQPWNFTKSNICTDVRFQFSLFKFYSSHGASPPRRGNYHKNPAPLPPKSIHSISSGDDSWGIFKKALVIYDYHKKTTTEVSLEKSQVVNILDAKPGAEWWRVKDDMGRIGYYPAHYLRMIW